MSDTETRIPEISNRRLRALMRRVRPVARFAHGKKGKFRHPEGFIYYLKPDARRANLDTPSLSRDTLFLLTALPAARARWLRVVDKVTTYYRWNHVSIFAPTVADTLAQIQDHPRLQDRSLGRIVAFEIEHLPIAGDAHTHQKGEYHFATITLYAIG